MRDGLPRVGLFPRFGLVERDPEAARSFLARVADAGLDHRGRQRASAWHR